MRTALLPNGKVLITGGEDGSGRYSQRTAGEFFDPLKNTFTLDYRCLARRQQHERRPKKRLHTATAY